MSVSSALSSLPSSPAASTEPKTKPKTGTETNTETDPHSETNRETAASQATEFNTQTLADLDASQCSVRTRARSKTAARSTHRATTTTNRKRKQRSSAENGAKRRKEDDGRAEIGITASAAGSKMLVGAHVSMAKGVHNAITNAAAIGGTALALFLKNQRRWVSAPLPDADAAAFRRLAEAHGIDPRTQVLPHGSYLINLATPAPDKAAQAYDCFVDDLRRCEVLGIGLYNFHPGSTLGAPRADALARIAAALNRAHAETSSVTTVIENMAGAGNVIGGPFEDLRDIIAGVADQNRVGVCLDTCHLFAAGHDLRSAAAYADVMDRFDAIVGRRFLRALHLNDSKGPLASHKDLHCNIGLGHLGLEAFRLIMNDPRLRGLPLVLETPSGDDPSVWAREIALLHSLVGLRGDEDAFLALAQQLHDQGQAERERVSDVVRRVQQQKEAKQARQDKGVAAAAKKTKKTKKTKKDEHVGSNGAGESDGRCSH